MEKVIKCMPIYSRLPPEERNATMKKFAEMKEPCALISTNLMSRGVELDVNYVIQMEIKDQFNEYVNRIGRTGRAGATGVAISLYDDNKNSAIRSDLIEYLKRAEQDVPDFLSSDY